MRAFVTMRQFSQTFSDILEKLSIHDKELADIIDVLKFLGEENQTRSDEIAAIEAGANYKTGWEDRKPIGFK
jgi:hypothetical protein